MASANSSGENRILEIENQDDLKKMTIVGEDSNVVMSETLHKRKKGYYRDLQFQDDSCSNKNATTLILALQNEFYHSFECAEGRHEFYIIKLDDGNYLSVENVYGIFSYSNKYWYDSSFKILKFEQHFGPNKIEYTNVDNPGYKIKVPLSHFLAKIKRDSINYKSSYYEIK